MGKGLTLIVPGFPEVRASPDLGLTLTVCVCSVWVPCVALPSGGGSSVGPSSLCGSPVWVPRPVVSAFHVASTRVMSNARAHAPAY